jgi:superfamily II DNA or RNA helicase
VNTENVVRIIKNNKAVIDSSDTGTGKTYTSIAACKVLQKRPIVICPKAVMTNWKRVCKILI